MNETRSTSCEIRVEESAAEKACVVNGVAIFVRRLLRIVTFVRQGKAIITRVKSDSGSA